METATKDHRLNKDSAFDFDTPIDRLRTASMKWDKYKDRDVIPMWVADMDFLSPPAVIEALQKRAAHGVFGYTVVPEALTAEVQTRLKELYGWTVEADWILWLPGLVTGLNVVCRAVGEDGDAVVTTVPVYPPFLKAPGLSRRSLITVPLSKTGNLWEFDFEELEEAVTSRSRLFILCHPYNPVGRVFSRYELGRLAAFCQKHDLVVCADEIHCDLILEPGLHHVPFAALDADIADRTITLMAPSKTYNIPGLGCSFAVISNPTLRRRVKASMEGIVPMVNAMGMTAALAAYRHGRPWLDALTDYLRENRDIVSDAVKHFAGLEMSPVQATYLAWIDTRPGGLQDPVGFFEAAGVGLSDGREFGGPGFVRLNFGCARSVLLKALGRMQRALSGNRR